MKILIIEDNEILQDNLKRFFEIQWYSVDLHWAYTWAVFTIITGSYDLVILDLWLWEWDYDGLDICEKVREKWISTPILMLTARTLVQQKVEWLNTWADDYMTKPFDYKELLARVKALHRRDQKQKWNKIKYEDIIVNTESFEVTQSWKLIQLSKLEFQLLLFLLQNQGTVLKKERILEYVWGSIDLFQHTRKLDIYVGYLRKKLWSSLIQTVHGVWYMIP